MKCPKDHTSLVVRERSGSEVDYCSHCHGAWLEKEELDKLIERSSTETQPVQHFHFQQGQIAPMSLMPSYDRETHDYPASDYRQQIS